MAFIQEKNIEINIGLKNKYKIVHFSDVHIVNYKDSDSKESIDEAIRAEKVWEVQRFQFAKGNSEHYDNSHNISSKQCLVNLVDYVNHIKPNGVVLTGDLLDYYSNSNYDFLLNQLSNLNYPFVFACGNHETPVSRYEDITYNKDGFMVLEFNDFKIISIDNSTKIVSEDTLECFKDELNDNKPILVAMHIPLITSYNKDIMIKYGEYFSIDENCKDKTTKEFIDILINNTLIKAILCGHVHGYCESYYAKDKKQYCASSGLIGKVNVFTIK